MRYLDTGGRDAEQSLYRWLEQTLPGASYFACQTGYFSGDGIYPLEKHFLDLFNVPGEMHLVVGANEAGVRSDDLTYVLDLYDQAPTGATTTLTVVAADDVLMHPKTYYVEHPDGSRHALVGSVNLTHPGLSRNMEAAIALSSADEPQAPFDDIRDAVLAWEAPARVNAYPVDRAAIGTLITEGILDVPKRTAAPRAPKAKSARKKYFPSVGARHAVDEGAGLAASCRGARPRRRVGDVRHPRLGRGSRPHHHRRGPGLVHREGPARPAAADSRTCRTSS
jgi:hypothetical protein